MPFLKRARALHERGNTVAAVISLVEGIKRHPDNTEAFRWMLDLYCEEVETTGLEEDLVKVIDVCPDPEGVYAYIFRRLTRASRQRYIKRLDRARRHTASVQGHPFVSMEALANGGQEPPPAPAPEHDATPTFDKPGPSTQESDGFAHQEEVVTAAVAAVAAHAPGAMTMDVSAPSSNRGAASAVALVDNGQSSHFSAPQAPMNWDTPLATPPLSEWIRPSRRNTPTSPVPAPVRPASPRIPVDDFVEDRAPQAPVKHEVAPVKNEQTPDEDEIHPVLKQRSEEVKARAVKLPSLKDGELPSELDDVRSGQWKRPRKSSEFSGLNARSFANVLDPDAVKSLEGLAGLPAEERSEKKHVKAIAPTGVRSAAYSSGYRSGAYDQEEGNWGKKVVFAVALILATAIVAAVVYRIAFVEPSVGNVEIQQPQGGQPSMLFLAPVLVEVEKKLLDVETDDPFAVEAAAQLRWSRALRSYLHGVNPVASTLNSAQAREDLKAWYISAEMLDSIRSGRVEEARSMLSSLRLASGRSPGFSKAMESWTTGELMLARGELSGAQAAYELSAGDGFVPGVVGLVDVCIRRGDISCARGGVANLKKLAPNHPTLPLANAALAISEDVLDRPLMSRPAKVEKPSSEELDAIAGDRRAAAWMALVDAEHAQKAGAQASVQHPLLQVSRARDLLQNNQIREAAESLQELRMDEVARPLVDARRALVVQGIAAKGRPDLALEHVGGPTYNDQKGIERFVKRSPRTALARAGLLFELGRYKDARALLRLLLDHESLGASARVIALQMHLDEGNLEEASRHIERMGQTSVAKTALAAIELYRDRGEEARGHLGVISAATLPDMYQNPTLYNFETRTRLLALHKAGEHQALGRFMGQVEISPALKARLLGAKLGESAFQEALAQNPTSLPQRLDLAQAALDAGKLTKALSWAKKVLKDQKNHAGAHLVAGSALLKLNQGKKALKHLRAASVSREDHAGILVDIAEAQLRSGKELDAVEILRKHMDKHPEDNRAMNLLGEAYFKTRRLTLGSKDLEQRVRRLDSRKYGLSVGEARLWLGRLYGSSEGNQRGGAQIRRARKLLGDRPDVLLAMGDYAREQGDGSYAIELYRTASNAKDAPVEVHLSLGKLALVRNQKGLAKTALTRYLESAPDGKSKSWARQQLKTIR